MSLTHQQVGNVDIYQRCFEDLLMMTETIFGENCVSRVEHLKKSQQISLNVSVFVGRRDSSSSKGSAKHSDDAKRDR